MLVGKMIFENLIGKRVSVLITGKSDKKETYMGIIVAVKDGYVFVESLPSASFEIETFIIRADIIESMWVFKEKC